MDVFSLYFQLGIEHITDPGGFDHMLFIITLCAIYSWRPWLNVLILITAFTLGHSLTLALSALDIFRLSADFIETLIPITILLTALYNLRSSSQIVARKQHLKIHYFLALFFGLIHGMGFSNFFRNLHGNDASIVSELFAFNIGIEAGQVAVVVIFMTSYFLLDRLFFIRQRDWTLFWSGAGAAISSLMIFGLV